MPTGRQQCEARNYALYEAGYRIQVGNATTGKASCRRCNDVIGLGELRIGKLERLGSTRMVRPHWYHPGCFLNYMKDTLENPEEQVPLDHDKILGFADLRAADKKIVCSVLTRGKALPTPAKRKAALLDGSMSADLPTPAKKRCQGKTGRAQSEDAAERQKSAPSAESCTPATGFSGEWIADDGVRITAVQTGEEVLLTIRGQEYRASITGNSITAGPDTGTLQGDQVKWSACTPGVQAIPTWTRQKVQYPTSRPPWISTAPATPLTPPCQSSH